MIKKKQGKLRMAKYSVLLLVATLLRSCSNNSWSTASREPAGISLSPDQHKAAVIEVYTADAYSWRGWFAVHTWIATKAENAPEYTVYEVTGWKLPALSQYKTATPDLYWFGSKPDKILSITGEKAKQLIPKISQAVGRYPWANEYTLLPGPNSNTFPSWIGIQVPELGLKMPFSAIGSGYAE